MVWAIGRDCEHLPITWVLKHFMYDATMSKRTVDEYSDIVIEDAKNDIEKFNISYGIYDAQLLTL